MNELIYANSTLPLINFQLYLFYQYITNFFSGRNYFIIFYYFFFHFISIKVFKCESV